MANNDPIKEYNSLNLKMERLKEKLEMSSTVDELVTDLHDCSNDLSDEGSRKEEIAHEKFANKIRQSSSRYDYNSKDVWSNKKVNYNNKSSAIVIIIVIIFMFIFVGTFFVIGTIINLSENGILEKLFEIGTSYIEEQEYGQEEYYTEELSEVDFKNYIQNIEIFMHIIDGDRAYMQINNSNVKSISNITVKIVFFDDNNNVLKICEEYVTTLIGNNVQFFDIYDAPSEYSNFQYNIVQEYGTRYNEVSREKIILTTENLLEGYYDTRVTLQNNTTKKLDSVELAIVYLKDEKIISIESNYIFEIKPGKKESEEFSLYKYKEFDEAIIFINDVNIY